MRTDHLSSSYRHCGQMSSYSGRSASKNGADNSTSPGPFNRSPEPTIPSAPPKVSVRKTRRSTLPPNAPTRDGSNQRRCHNPTGPSRRRRGMPQKNERQLDWGDSSDIGVFSVSRPPEMRIPRSWSLTPEPLLQTPPVMGTFLPGIHQPTGHPGRNAAARTSQVSNDYRMKKSQIDTNTNPTASQAPNKQSTASTSRKVQICGFDNMYRGNQFRRSSVDGSRHNTSYKSCENEQAASAQRRSSFCRPTAERGNLMRLCALPQKLMQEQDYNNQEHKLQDSPSTKRSTGAHVKVIRLDPCSEPKY